MKSKLSRVSSPGNGHFSPLASTNSLFQNLQEKKRKIRRGAYDEVMYTKFMILAKRHSCLQEFVRHRHSHGRHLPLISVQTYRMLFLDIVYAAAYARSMVMPIHLGTCYAFSRHTN